MNRTVRSGKKMRKIRSDQNTTKCGTTGNRFCNYSTRLAWCLLVTTMIIAQSEALMKTKDPGVNNRPIIGILAQESTGIQEMFPNENYTVYIAASYVKAVEASGARVVPIMIGKHRNYYEDIMSKLNGVLLPGGSANLSRSAVNGYADAGEHIYEIAMELNDAGDYFPVFGICLGFEYLVTLAEGRGDKSDLVPCNCHDSLPLNFTADFRGSKMFRGADDGIIEVLSTKPVTINSHDYCVMEDNLVNHNLTKDWRVTSFSDSKHGIHFISSIENIRYPIYGTQFHPEKSAYEWTKSKHYPSDKQAVVTNRYFYDFFINECRKNFHSFPNVEEENAKLIYNYSPHYTGSQGIMFEQCYVF